MAHDPESRHTIAVLFFEKKGHRAFPLIELVVLARLTQNEIGLASNHGTMPRQAAESLGLKLSV